MQTTSSDNGDTISYEKCIEMIEAIEKNNEYMEFMKKIEDFCMSAFEVDKHILAEFDKLMGGMEAYNHFYIGGFGSINNKNSRYAYFNSNASTS